MTPTQAREARKLLGWSADRLAGQCNFNASVIRAFETTGRVVGPLRDPTQINRLVVVRTALETAGVVFTDGEEPGVKLRKVEG